MDSAVRVTTKRRHRPATPTRGRAGDAAAAPDEEVCRRLEAGDAAAAEIVYERVVGVVDAALFRLLGPYDHEREDLAQQAMERVIATIVSGRCLRDCSLSSWATLITQHLAIDAMRARPRDRKVFDRHVGTQAVEFVPDGGRSARRAGQAARGVLAELRTARRDRRSRTPRRAGATRRRTRRRAP